MLITCNHCNTKHNCIDNIPVTKCSNCHKPIKANKNIQASKGNKVNSRRNKDE